MADDLLDLGADGLERDAERLERLGGDALALVDQPEQDVLGADVVVVEQARFFLRQDDDSAGSVGEALEHGMDPPLVVGRIGPFHPQAESGERRRSDECNRPGPSFDLDRRAPTGAGLPCPQFEQPSGWRMFPQLRSVSA